MPYSFEIGAGPAVTLSGTVSVTGGTGLVTGVGTNFLTTLATNDLVLIGTEWRKVVTVFSDTQFSVGFTYVNSYAGVPIQRARTANLSSLATPIPHPKSDFDPYSRRELLGNNTRRGYGRPVVEWRWGFLTRAQRDMLRTFCPEDSAEVFIRSRKNDNADAYFYAKAVMLWIDGAEEKDAGRRPSFTIRFQNVYVMEFA